MKKVLLMMVSALLLMSCGASRLSPEERAVRRAAIEENAKKAIADQNFRINVTMVRPMFGQNQTVSGYWIKVDTTHVQCYIPKIRPDDQPQFRTSPRDYADRKLEFTSPLDEYLYTFNSETNVGLITFKTLFGGDEYRFYIQIENVDEARVRILPGDRNEVSCEGTITPIGERW
jgi:hypothetical protein